MNKKNLFAAMMAAFIVNASMTAFAGWQQAATGAWYYQDNATAQYVSNNWVNDNGAWYYMGQDGVMKTGWVNVSNKWYYMSGSGAMKTGWVLDNGTWYYLQPNGVMAADQTVKSNGKSYYLDASGKMVHDAEHNGVYYGSDGAAVTDYFDKTEIEAESSIEQTERQYRSFDHDEWVEEVVRLANKERKKHGRKPLEISYELCEYADERAEECVEKFAHTRPDGSSCFTILDGTSYENCAAAENLAKGHTSPQDVINGWMNSTGHRKNLLNKDYKEIGVGVCYENGVYIWAQLFAS